MQWRRRDVLRGAAWIGAAGLLPRIGGATEPVKSDSFARCALVLGDTFAGWILGYRGGRKVGEVTASPGSWGLDKKLAGVHLEDIVFTAGAGMSRAFHDWLAAALAGTGARTDGKLVLCGENRVAVQEHRFTQALVTEIGFPALGVSAGEEVGVTVRLQPQSTLRGSLTTAPPAETPGVKAWSGRNFRLKIDGLDCSQVFAVEVPTVRVTGPAIAVKPGANVELTDLGVFAGPTSGAAFDRWGVEFLNAKPGAGVEKTGTLELLDSTMTKVVFTIKLKGLGVFRVEPHRDASHGVMTKAEMYCERLEYSVPPPK